MKLRKYCYEDSATICNWITDEKSLYLWSADRIGRYPLSDNDLNEYYVKVMDTNKFIPLSAIDEKDELIGHFFIRYPNEVDKRIVRLGFVIICPNLRGSGRGKELLHLAIDYAKNTLKASKLTLGVFSNNDSARCCYEAVGFKPTGEVDTYVLPIGELKCMEMELLL